ncbi:MAG: 30S ribosomal protein S8 [Candidatus Anstonellales archaeon]
MLTDTLADMLNTIKVAEHKGIKEVKVRSTKLAKEVLKVMERYNYVKGFSEVEENGKKFLKVQLAGTINMCGVIKPRAPVSAEEWPEKEQQYLLGYNTGILIVTTSAGVMSNREAFERRIGGRLLGYIY